MTDSKGNSEFCFPSTSMFPSASPRGALRVSGKQTSLFPLRPYNINPREIVISLCPCVPRQNSVFYTTHCSKIWRKLPLSEPCSRTGDLETFVVWLCASVGCACESLPWDPSRRFIANFISATSAVSVLIFASIDLNDRSTKSNCNYKVTTL